MLSADFCVRLFCVEYVFENHTALALRFLRNGSITADRRVAIDVAKIVTVAHVVDNSACRNDTAFTNVTANVYDSHRFDYRPLFDFRKRRNVRMRRNERSKVNIDVAFYEMRERFAYVGITDGNNNVAVFF